jgi:hypothetical protein
MGFPSTLFINDLKNIHCRNAPAYCLYLPYTYQMHGGKTTMALFRQGV